MNLDRIIDRVDPLTTRWGPTVVRWTAGMLWLANVNWKWPPDFGRSGGRCGGFCGYVQAGIDHPVLPGAPWLFEHLIRPNLGVFGWMTLIIEGSLAVLLLSGRYVRFAAVLGVIQSFAILTSVANAPNEWYWAYLLMIGLHLAVLTMVPTARAQPAGVTAIAVAILGAIVAIAHLGAGFTGDGNRSWSVFAQDNTLPGDAGRNLFPGSIAVGLILVAVGVGGWFVATKAEAARRRMVGWVLLGVSAVLVATYRNGELGMGLGARITFLCALAAVGLALAAPVGGVRPSHVEPLTR